MTKPEAKVLTLEVWTYLAEHPEICSKRDLPPELYTQIFYLAAECPLCEVLGPTCRGCPIRGNFHGLPPGRYTGCCSRTPHLFKDWNFGNETQRAVAAQRIVNRTSRWNPKE